MLLFSLLTRCNMHAFDTIYILILVVELLRRLRLLPNPYLYLKENSKFYIHLLSPTQKGRHGKTPNTQNSHTGYNIL